LLDKIQSENNVVVIGLFEDVSLALLHTPMGSDDS
jgi:hypothetical protein